MVASTSQTISRALPHIVPHAALWSRWWFGLMLTFSLLMATTPGFAQPASDKSAPATSYAALADLLENDKTREQLITELRALAEAPAPAAQGDKPADANVPENKAANKANNNSTSRAVGAGDENAARQDGVLFSRNIAAGIERFIASVSADLAQTAAAFRGLSADTGEAGAHEWRSALRDIALVLLATVIAFLIFRRIAAIFFARSNAWVMAAAREQAAEAEAAGAPAARNLASIELYRKVVAMIVAMVVDTGAILLAGAAGYAVAVFVTGERNDVTALESLFINTFVAVEISKALVRAVFAPRYERLRLFAMDDDVAAFWGRWLERLIGVIGYGILFGVPLVKLLVTPLIGHVFGVVVILAAYIYAVRVIWKRRSAVRERMTRYATQSSTAVFSTLIRVLARTWHVLAIAYFTVLLVVSQIDPENALPFMAEATAQTLLAVGIGLLLSAFVAAALARRISLSDDLNARLPMLEARINSYVPRALKGFQMLTMLAVVLVVLDAWRVFNLASWVASDSGRAVILAVVHVSIILVIATLIWTTVASIIEHRLSPAPGLAGPSEREKTLLSLFRNAALVVIVTLTVLVVLSQIGIDIAPLIAGAGVAGLAIGFGAQKLVQDVITGVFIQLENGMNQNDVVQVAGIFGTVEKITIRTVGLRTLDGGFHLIPFSSIDKVSNHTRDFSYHYAEYAIAYREDVDQAIVQLERAFEELMQDKEMAAAVLEDISIPGVTSFHERGFNIRVLIKTLPGMQWPVQRAFNRLVKKYFNQVGIELPYPHTVLYFGDGKNGKPASLPGATETSATGLPQA